MNTTTQPNEPAVLHVVLPVDLRDYFAAKALEVILRQLDRGIRPQDCIRAAEDAYFMADAMLKARNA